MVTGQAALSGICSASHERPFAAIPLSQHLHIVPVVLPFPNLYHWHRVSVTNAGDVARRRRLCITNGRDAPDLTTRIEKIRHDNVHVGA